MNEGTAKPGGKLGFAMALVIFCAVCAVVAWLRPILLVYIAGMTLPLAIIHAFETTRPRLMSACCATMVAALCAPVVLAGVLHSDRDVHLEVVAWAVPLGGLAAAAAVAAVLPWLFGRTHVADQRSKLDRMSARADELREVWGDRLDRPNTP